MTSGKPDGAKVTTLDLASTTTSYRQVAYHRSWPTAGPHTLRLVVEGTAGRRMHDIDDEVVTVGRGQESSIFLDDVTVSRKHAEILRGEPPSEKGDS